MTCATCREALSARMDGEEEPLPPQQVEEHLAGCRDCRRWQAAATAVTRSIRVRPATATPDLTERILTTVAFVSPPIVRSSRSGWLPVIRWLLGGVAFVQLTLALGQLLGVGHIAHAATGAAEHFFNESAAWNFALAIGFLVAAVSPALARGLLPAVGVFVGVLAVVSVGDVVSGVVDGARLSSHVIVVVGVALLALVDWQYRRNPLPGRGNQLEDPNATISSGSGAAAAGPASNQQVGRTPGRWLRPAGRRAA